MDSIHLRYQTKCGKISLHALPDGQSMYTAAGFRRIETDMRLDI